MDFVAVSAGLPFPILPARPVPLSFLRALA